MPERALPPPLYDPPRVIDRIFVHWAELILAVMGLKQGLRGVYDIAQGGFVLGLPFWVSMIVSLFLISGSSLWVFTLLVRFEKLSTYMKWQRIGLSFTGLAWAASAVAGYSFRGMFSTPQTTSILLAIAVAGLALITWIYEDRIHALAYLEVTDER